MLTKRTKYALQSLEYLARVEPDKQVLIADLARDEGIPRKFLERILLELKSRGILRSRKGKGGGYRLAKPPGAIMIGEVVRVMDGPLAPVSCVSRTAYAPCPECREEATCGIRLVMEDVRNAISDVLDRTSLADMLERTRRADEVRKGLMNYDI